ncbi:FAD binding domain-containing protein [Schizophyllum commune]
MRKSFIDVLIIGAGPSGLMAATALKRAGIDVRIVDKRPHGILAGQADGIQPRTSEILQTYGLADELFRQGCQLRVTSFYNPSTEHSGIELSGRVPTVTAPARYPYILTLHQAAIEKIFQDAMRSMGIEVERSVIPTAVDIVEERRGDPEAYAVKVCLSSADTLDAIPNEVVSARFVIGTDGARSWTRKALGIVLEGEQTDLYWGVIDFVADTDFPDIRNQCMIHTRYGSILVIPREGDLVRLYVQMDKEALELDEAGDFDRTKMSPEKLLEAARLRLRPYYLNLENPEAGYHWWTIYRIGQRVANKYGVHERVFLAGDATHTHSPKAGQGMNAGICDAHNLAWKIAQVLHGHADLSLLKTYELERRTFAQSLIAFDKEYATLFSTPGITHEEFLQVHCSFSPFISGMDFTYPPSPITRQTQKKYASGLVIGRPVPPHVFIRVADARPVNIQDMLPSNGKFKILVFAGEYTRDEFLPDLRQFADGLVDILAKYGKTSHSEVMDIVIILSGKHDPACLLQVPSTLRPHWAQVVVDDDVDVHGHSAGGGYEKFGIDSSRGAIVVVRPDSFVGAVAPLQGINALTEYFDGFWTSSI